MRYSFNAKLSLTDLLVRWAVLALGVMLATQLVDGIRYDTHTTLLKVVLLMSLFNAVLKPLLLLFTLPFIMLTLGLGVLVINALLFLWVGHLVAGFQVDGFWPALWGALIVSLTNVFASALLRRGPRPPRGRGGPPAATGKGGGEVIDI
jgi:putative membrane protein